MKEKKPLQGMSVPAGGKPDGKKNQPSWTNSSALPNTKAESTPCVFSTNRRGRKHFSL
jgi:hypothetical protein